MTDRKESASQRTLVSINRRAFIQVTVLLAVLLFIAVALTFIVPRGDFGVLPEAARITPNISPGRTSPASPSGAGCWPRYWSFSPKTASHCSCFPCSCSSSARPFR